MERLYNITDPRGNKWLTTLDHYGDGKEFLSDALIMAAIVCAIAAGMIWVLS
jgi:hypothetical protein